MSLEKKKNYKPGEIGEPQTWTVNLDIEVVGGWFIHEGESDEDAIRRVFEFGLNKIAQRFD